MTTQSVNYPKCDGRELVLFRDGTAVILPVFLYGGACFVGEATAYCVRGGQMVWVRPGESVEWIEV